MPQVDAGRVRIHVEEQGQGEPLLLIMGITAQLTLWPQGFVDRLADRGFRVIRFDNRDVGLSERLHDAPVIPPQTLLWARMRGRRPPAPYTLVDMARDTVGVLDALGLADAHFVGASMGGMIAQLCAIKHPDRVRTLTPIMSSPGDTWNTTGDPRVALTLMRLRPTNAEEAAEARLRIARAFNAGGLPIDEAAARERGRQDFRRSHYPAGAARHFAAMLATPPWGPRLSSVRCPTHVMHGTHDPLIPPRGGKAIARAIPGATLQLIERMGHHLPEVVWDPLIDGICACVARAREGAREVGNP